jgi:acetate kinase
MNIVVVNSGSSSLKMSMFKTQDQNRVSEQADWEDEQDIDWQKESPENIELKMSSALSKLWEGGQPLLPNRDQIDIVGHRIVHGGASYLEPVEITAQVLADLDKLTEIAPLHNPINMSALKLAQKILPKAKHIAVFDTSFHSTLKPEACIYPGPYSWFSELKIKKYGFHGISHKYVSRKALELRKDQTLQLPRLVSCHLGGGCSLAAIGNGISVDTTMGFTPLEGLMMRSRSGSIDPGVLIYLLKNNKYTVDDLERVLNKESGMKGIFEQSADFREITKAMKNGDERAKLTFDMFVHRLCSGIGSMLAVLGGIDGLIFTGGIGSNSSILRDVVCRKLAFLGMELNEELNKVENVDLDAAKPESKVRIYIIKSREDWQIATESTKFFKK